MARPAEPRIVRAEAWMCPLELRYPLHLGAITYYTRDYVVLRLTTEDGRVGSAIGYTRNTPLLESLRILCQQLSDLPTDPERAQHALNRRFAPGWAALIRAASLMDVALWDLRAQAEHVPLATALGYQPRPVPAMAVAGYFSDRRDVNEQLDEMDRFVADGYSTLKLILPGHDADADLAFLERVRGRVPATVAIGVDFHGAFESVDTAVAHCAAMHDLDVRFFEDPFPSADWHHVRDFAAAIPTPVAAGEDLPTLTGLVDLLDNGVQFLRADATASGGYTIARQAVAHSRARDASLVPHVWPHLHVHLAAGGAADTPVEVIPDYVGADPVWSLLHSGPPMREGMWHPSEEPGLGLPLDFNAVHSHSTHRFSHEVPQGAAVTAAPEADRSNHNTGIDS